MSQLQKWEKFFCSGTSACGISCVQLKFLIDWRYLNISLFSIFSYCYVLWTSTFPGVTQNFHSNCLASSLSAPHEARLQHRFHYDTVPSGLLWFRYNTFPPPTCMCLHYWCLAGSPILGGFGTYRRWCMSLQGMVIPVWVLCLLVHQDAGSPGIMPRHYELHMSSLMRGSVPSQAMSPNKPFLSEVVAVRCCRHRGRKITNTCILSRFWAEVLIPHQSAGQGWRWAGSPLSHPLFLSVILF